MTYHYHGIDAEESILTKSPPNLGTWALPDLFFIIKTRVTEISLPKWSLGSPHSDFLSLLVATFTLHTSTFDSRLRHSSPYQKLTSCKQ